MKHDTLYELFVFSFIENLGMTDQYTVHKISGQCVVVIFSSKELYRTNCSGNQLSKIWTQLSRWLFSDTPLPREQQTSIERELAKIIFLCHPFTCLLFMFMFICQFCKCNISHENCFKILLTLKCDF